MKIITSILLSFLLLLALTQCKNTSPDTLTNNADSRAKTISALLNNDTYMNQVMDSMRTKHPEAVLAAIFIMAKSDKQVPQKMMAGMVDMCKRDTAMTAMMVSQTMNMLDDSKLSCCATGKMLMADQMAMNPDDQSDCCAKGRMKTGKSGEMSAADKLTCCKMGMSKKKK